jgi:N-methylhydantoinase A
MRDRFQAMGFGREIAFQRTLQMRFVGQAFEIDVPAPRALSEASLREAFDEAHRLVYFHSSGAGIAGKRIEIVGFRIGASVPEQCVLPAKVKGAGRALRKTVVHENRQERECTVCERAHLEDPAGVPGPLLVEDETSTIYVPPAWRAANDAAGNLVLKRERE